MPNTLQIRRGLQASIPIGSAGELLFTTDTKRLYISDGSATNLLQGASSLLTTGAIPFSDANGKLTMNASSFYWDNTNSRLGIGTASPTTGLTVSKALTTTGNELLNITYTHSSYSSGQIQLGQYFNNTRINFIHGANNSAMYLGGANFTIETQNVGNFILSNGTERMRMVATTGNILIGTTTDAGYKLDVNGTARVSGTTTVQSLLVPTTNLYDLGTLGVRFRSGYFKGILIATEMYAEQFRFAATNYPILNLGGTQIAQYFGTGNLLIQTGGTFTDVASSLLTINSTTKGFLPPRMTTTEKNAIASPAAGLVVYDTNLGKLCVRGASAWETITSL